jgi:hypothetical protein
MATFKIDAGKQIETVTPAELEGSLKAWMVDAAKGLRIVQIQAQGTANATTGAVRVGGHVTLTGGKVGPKAGFVWAVQRLAVRIADTPAAYNLYINANNPNNFVRDVSGAMNGYCSFGKSELVLLQDDALVFTANADAGAVVSITGAAIEAPVGLLYKLLG